MISNLSEAQERTRDARRWLDLVETQVGKLRLLTGPPTSYGSVAPVLKGKTLASAHRAQSEWSEALADRKRLVQREWARAWSDLVAAECKEAHAVEALQNTSTPRSSGFTETKREVPERSESFAATTHETKREVKKIMDSKQLFDERCRSVARWYGVERERNEQCDRARDTFVARSVALAEDTRANVNPYNYQSGGLPDTVRQEDEDRRATELQRELGDLGVELRNLSNANHPLSPLTPGYGAEHDRILRRMADCIRQLDAIKDRRAGQQRASEDRASARRFFERQSFAVAKMYASNAEAVAQVADVRALQAQQRVIDAESGHEEMQRRRISDHARELQKAQHARRKAKDDLEKADENLRAFKKPEEPESIGPPWKDAVGAKPPGHYPDSVKNLRPTPGPYKDAVGTPHKTEGVPVMD